MNLLTVNNLTVRTEHQSGPINILDNLNFKLERGKSLGVVGESGCGKSMTAFAIMGLLPDNMTASGEVMFGNNLLNLPERELCKIRGNRISMVFQEPMSALNPVQPIGFQVAESLILHKNLSRHQAQRQASKVLDRVGLPAKKISRSLYPHQLSGGQRQMVAMAKALMVDAKVLLLDEPTAGLSPKYRGEIFSTIKEINSTGVPILIVEQNAKQALGCANRGYVLVDGTNRFQGTGTDLLEDREVARMFLGGGE